ncbi:Uncharacterised protein [Bordetella pertussis]|nr:Uncharacterised protein [Bordetella pertussis]
MSLSSATWPLAISQSSPQLALSAIQSCICSRVAGLSHRRSQTGPVTCSAKAERGSCPPEANQAGDTMITRRVLGVRESATASSTLTMPYDWNMAWPYARVGTFSSCGKNR